MFISKKHLSRRDGAEGRGRHHRAAAARCDEPRRRRPGRRRRRARRRSGWRSSASRTAPIMDHWSPAQTGAATTTMSPILEPLATFRQHMTIVSGLRNKPAETPEPHGYIERTWLSCVTPWEHGVAGPDAGVTADQLAARHIGQETRLPSLELTTAQRGAQHRLAHADAVAAAGRQPARGVLEAVRPGRHRRRARGDPARDRQHPRPRQGAGRAAAGAASASATARRSSDYLDSVREIERRVQMASQQDTSTLDIPDAPIGMPNDIDRALQADVRPDGARVPGRHHARHHVLDGPRSEHADVHEPRHRRSVPSALASRRTTRRSRRSWCRSRRYHTEVFAQVHRAAGEGAGRRRHGARSLDDSLRQQHEQQRSAQQRSAAGGDPRARARPHQGRPAPEVSAGLAASPICS